MDPTLNPQCKGPLEADRKNYAVVWRAPGAVLAWGVTPPSRPVPCFLDGAALEHHRAGRPFRLDAFMALRGLLHGWFEGAPRARSAAGRGSRFALERAWLASLAVAMGLDRAGAVLAAAARTRAANGRVPAARMLVAGVAGCPRSTALRMALVREVWGLLEAVADLDRRSACETLVRAHEGMDPAARTARSDPTVHYAYLAALHLLGRREAMVRAFWAHGARQVTDEALRGRLLRLLRGERLAMAELRIDPAVCA